MSLRTIQELQRLVINSSEDRTRITEEYGATNVIQAVFNVRYHKIISLAEAKIAIEYVRRRVLEVLADAVRCASVETVKYIIDNYDDLDMRNVIILHAAGESGSIELVESLPRVTRVKDSTLTSALTAGNRKLANHLIQNYGFRISGIELIFAAESGDKGLADDLLSYGARSNSDAIERAVECGHIEMARYLVEKLEDDHPVDCDPTLLDSITKIGDKDLVEYAINKWNLLPSALHINIAAGRNNSELVEYLVELTGEEPDDWALAYAAKRGNEELLEWLMERYNIAPTGRVATCAAESGNDEFFMRLLHDYKLPANWITLCNALRHCSLHVADYLVTDYNVYPSDYILEKLVGYNTDKSRVEHFVNNYRMPSDEKLKRLIEGPCKTEEIRQYLRDLRR